MTETLVCAHCGNTLGEDVVKHVKAPDTEVTRRRGIKCLVIVDFNKALREEIAKAAADIQVKP